MIGMEDSRTSDTLELRGARRIFMDSSWLAAEARRMLDGGWSGCWGQVDVGCWMVDGGW